MRACSKYSQLFLYMGCLSIVAAESEADDVVQLGSGKREESVMTSGILDPVMTLNRYIFHGNVLKTGKDNSADHWVVMFCPPWWHMCEKMVEPFGKMKAEWERKLNKGLLTRDIRFAKVDCAKDKPLCNDQEVEGYPTVHHYSGGQRVATWNGGRQNDPERLTKWLQGQFSSLAVDKLQDEIVGMTKQPPTLDSVMQNAKRTMKQFAPGEYATDTLLFIGILALVARAVCENPKVWQTHQRYAKPANVAFDTEPPTPPETEMIDTIIKGRHISGVVRFLPEDWTTHRPSIEL